MDSAVGLRPAVDRKLARRNVDIDPLEHLRHRREGNAPGNEKAAEGCKSAPYGPRGGRHSGRN